MAGRIETDEEGDQTGEFLVDIHKMRFMQGNDGGFEHVAGQEVANGGRSLEGVADMADGADGKGAAAGISDAEYRFAEHEEGLKDGRSREDEVLKWCLSRRDRISRGICINDRANKRMLVLRKLRRKRREDFITSYAEDRL